MAVLDEVPHVTARIRVAGELAIEYDPLDDQETIVNLDNEGVKIPKRVCYIESKSGAEFAIEIAVSDKYQPPHSHNCFIVTVYIDGQLMRSKSVDVPLSRRREKTILISSGKVEPETGGGEPMFGKFVFAPITKTSDSMSADRLKEDLKRAETLGTIRLCLATGRCNEKEPRKHSVRYSTSQVAELAEKALKGKAISHVTMLAETTEKPSSNVQSTRDRRLVGEIFFRYRSYQALQHELIIPRTPSPEPLVTTGIDANALAHLSESDIRRLALERLRDTQIKNETSHVKREAEEASQSPRQWKSVKMNDGKEVVDLTDE